MQWLTGAVALGSDAWCRHSRAVRPESLDRKQRRVTPIHKEADHESSTRNVSHSTARTRARYYAATATKHGATTSCYAATGLLPTATRCLRLSGLPAYYPQQAMPTPAPQASFLNERFVKGVLIGAAAAYILTNENVQRTAIKSAVKAWSLLQGGVEELKERFQDAEAEIRAEAGDE
ncbi:hypothetical protein [Candidatus Thiothrix anitrata]|uniref:YtxH domain-containing protein n=1 Tax=Candidatus Thiothrix anitrata TaxID=2823902 RepID=A0ABX7X070_9GAMM|nr:hypothetical protein [Candidatus Thiothrix anitrata]QTR49285.1 hypothetical protein J8380_13605 [Candidatus Thiothrix anitrata]